MRPILALACLALALPALALDGDGNDFFQKLKAGGAAVQAQQAARAKDYKDQNKIDAVLVAMGDGNEVGGAVADFVKEKGLKIKLDAKLPDYPRVLAPMIVEKASSAMLGDMPKCAERQYMALSMGVRTWLELGGDKTKLPVIEPINGWKDQILADQFKLWLDNGSEMTLYKISQASKTPDLMTMLDQEKDPAKRKAIEAANKRFTDFLLAESNWKQANSFRLK